MTNTNDKTVETLFNSFLHADPGGDLAEVMHTISAAIDAQIEAGAVDPDTIADYEYSAMKFGFYSGYLAALNMMAAKAQRALEKRREQFTVVTFPNPSAEE